MDINIHASFLPHDDPEASVTFYRDTLGFEIRADVGQGGMRWITVGPPDQPTTSIVLEPPAADPGITDDERRTITEMMAKGTYARVLLATRDLDATFEGLQASGAEIVQEPIEQRTPENRSNKPIRNRWQPAATVSQRMVRRGSTVRVRQRA